jgi:hypothetical protein
MGIDRKERDVERNLAVGRHCTRSIAAKRDSVGAGPRSKIRETHLGGMAVVWLNGEWRVLDATSQRSAAGVSTVELETVGQFEASSSCALADASG